MAYGLIIKNAAGLITTDQSKFTSIILGEALVSSAQTRGNGYPYGHTSGWRTQAISGVPANARVWVGIVNLTSGDLVGAAWPIVTNGIQSKTQFYWRIDKSTVSTGQAMLQWGFY